MLGRYRWESNLTVEQLMEAVAERVPQLYKAETGMVYWCDQSGKLIFYDLHPEFLPTGTLLTCQGVAGEDGCGIVLTGRSPWFFNFLIAVTTGMLLPGYGGASLWRGPLILVFGIPVAIIVWVLVLRRKKRKTVLDLLDNIMGSRQVTARKAKQS